MSNQGNKAMMYNSVPKVDLYKSAKNLKSKCLPTWEQQCQLFADRMDTVDKEIRLFDACLSNTGQEYQEHFKLYKCEINNLELEIPNLNTLLESNNTLLCFVWDMTSPLLNNEYDNAKPKFHAIKKALGITNIESAYLEGSRSSLATLRKKDENVPYFNNNDELYRVGEYRHLKNRNQCHIGILVDKPHHETSVEENRLSQWHVDTTQGEHSGKTQLCKKMIEELTKGTKLR